MELADAAAANLRMLSDASWVGTGVGNYQALAAIYRDSTGLPGQVPVDTMASMILGLRRGAAHCNLAASAADCASSRSVDARQGFVFCSDRGGLPGHDCMRDLLRCELRRNHGENAGHDDRCNGSRPDPRQPSEVTGLTAYADRLATVVHSLDAPGIWIRTHR